MQNSPRSLTAYSLTAHIERIRFFLLEIKSLLCLLCSLTQAAPRLLDCEVHIEDYGLQAKVGDSVHAG
jgi:hypothetical protein